MSYKRWKHKITLIIPWSFFFNCRKLDFEFIISTRLGLLEICWLFAWTRPCSQWHTLASHSIFHWHGHISPRGCRCILPFWLFLHYVLTVSFFAFSVTDVLVFFFFSYSWLDGIEVAFHKVMLDISEEFSHLWV